MPLSGSGTEQSLTLRLTGLEEEAGEDRKSLLQKVDAVLHTLPCRVSASDASRQGNAGSRSRAVIMTFATEDQRLSILRCKARLGRQEDTRKIGINEVLTPEQQQHVHRLWDLCRQARQAGLRASIRGCNLFIDGQWVDPEQIAAQGQQHQAGLAPNAPPLLHGRFPQQPTQYINNPLATMSVPMLPNQQNQQQYPQPHSLSSHPFPTQQTCPSQPVQALQPQPHQASTWHPAPRPPHRMA